MWGLDQLNQYQGVHRVTYPQLLTEGNGARKFVIYKMIEKNECKPKHAEVNMPFDEFEIK